MECFSRIQVYFKIPEINLNDRLITFPTSKVIEKTTEQIIRGSLHHFNLPRSPNVVKNYHAYIRSKKMSSGKAIFKFEVPKNIKPITCFNYLSFFPTQQTQEFADTYLIISQKIYPSFFEMPLYNLKTKNYLLSFPVYVEFPFKLTDIVKRISTAFPDLNPKTDIKLFNYAGSAFNVDEPLDQFEVIQNALKMRFCAAISYEEHDKTYTKILCRESVIKEIFQRVNKNNEFYENFDKSQQFLSQCPGIAPEVVQEIYSQTLCLKGLHQELKKKIDNFNRTDYMAPVGRIFSKFMKFFQFYKNVEICINKHQIISILKQNQAQFLANAEYMKLSNNLPIDQYFNFLFKTLFDYQELFKNLFKYTPPSHPDYKNCKKTVKDFIKVVSDINAGMILEENRTFYESILQKYKRHVNDLRKTGIQYIESYVICTKKIALQSNNLNETMPLINDSFQKRLLMLLSNCIIFAKQNPSNELVYQNYYPVDMHGFYPYKNRGLFYSFYEDPITYSTIKENALYDTNLIEFQTENERNQFFNLYRCKVADLHPVGRQKSQTSFELNDTYDMFQLGGKVKIETIPIEKEIHLSNHSFEYYKDGVFFAYGGKDENGTSIKTFRQIKLNGRHVQIIPHNTTERFDTLMVNTENNLYIYGGTTDGITPLNELYKLVKGNDGKLDFLKKATDSPVQPIPSFGYDLIYFPRPSNSSSQGKNANILILIGGSSEFNCYHYLIETNLWRKKKLNGVVLKSLVGHKAVKINDEAVAIIGGKTTDDKGNTVYNNAVIIYYPFRLNGNNLTVLRTTGLYPFNRCNHHVIPLNKYLLIVFGGEYAKLPTNPDSQKYEEYFETLSHANEMNAIYLLNLITGQWSFLSKPLNEDMSFLSVKHGGVSYIPPETKYGTSTIYFYNGIIKENEYLTDMKKMTVEMTVSDNDTIPETFELITDTFYHDLLSTNIYKELPFPQKPELTNPYQRKNE